MRTPPLDKSNPVTREGTAQLAMPEELDAFNKSSTKSIPLREENTILSRPRHFSDDPWQQRLGGYGHEGEGSDITTVQKIAAKRQITTANMDRWKRTFQAVRAMVRSDADNKHEEDETYDQTLHSQVTSVGQDEWDEEDYFEEISRREFAKSWGVVSPDSFFKAGWDMVGMIFVVIQALYVPFKLAFVINVSSLWSAFEVVMDVFFMLDISITISLLIIP